MNEAGKNAANEMARSLIIAEQKDRLAHNMSTAEDCRAENAKQQQMIKDWCDEALIITLRHLAIYGPFPK